MQAIITDNHWIRLTQVFPEVEDLIDDHFSEIHPNHYFVKDNKEQSWDGYYRKYSRSKKALRLPLLYELIELCKKHDIPLDVVDTRGEVSKPDPSIVTKDFLPCISLEDYQVNAIKATVDNDIGIIKAPTGAGKSEIAAGIIKLHNLPTVVIAEQRIIIEQLKERLELREIVDEVGLFYGGATPDGQKVIVGSIQSLTSPPSSLSEKNPDVYRKRKKRAKQFQSIVKKAKLLLVDECDLATNKSYQYLFRNYFNGRKKYGFSATPFDHKKKVQNLHLREHLGSIIYEVSRKDVESAGRIIPIKFVSIVYGEDGNKHDKTAFDIAEQEIIIQNGDFHDKVAKIVESFPDDGTLILVDTSNIIDLGHALEKRIKDSVFIYGKTSQAARKKALVAFENREIKCLIGGRILKRGLDLKGGADNLIILGGGKLWSDFNQKIGRAVRRNDKGWARVFTFFFLNNYYLYKHSREQLKAVVNMGYDASLVFKDMTIDGHKFIKSRFRKPKMKS